MRSRFRLRRPRLGQAPSGLLVVIPEPGSGILLGAALAALGALRRSRRRA